MSFDGRVFLTTAEWETYLRRMPVRYIKRQHSTTCHLCGLPPEEGNPLQHSHLIPFNLGVKKYRLTPDFLDSEHNIVSAHRSVCNKGVELAPEAVEALLSALK